MVHYRLAQNKSSTESGLGRIDGHIIGRHKTCRNCTGGILGAKVQRESTCASIDMTQVCKIGRTSAGRPASIIHVQRNITTIADNVGIDRYAAPGRKGNSSTNSAGVV